MGARLTREARKLGLDLLRMTGPEVPSRDVRTFRRWVTDGCHAGLTYLADRVSDPGGARRLLPGCRSVIVAAANYYRPMPVGPAPGHGAISRYAVCRDYHRVLLKPLNALARILRRDGAMVRCCVDTAPVLERAYAVAAGLGFIGRNTCLITPQFGSWVFLGLILTDQRLPRHRPLRGGRRCGGCRCCIDACPTGALRPDRTIDARRCLSFLTVENRGEYPPVLRRRGGVRLFGCDTCQAVCPHNQRHARPCDERLWGAPRVAPEGIPIADCLEFPDHAAFAARFAGTPIMRAKRLGMLRNACVAAGNSGRRDLTPALQRVCDAPSDAMPAAHARWALEQLAADRLAAHTDRREEVGTDE